MLEDAVEGELVPEELLAVTVELEVVEEDVGAVELLVIAVELELVEETC